MQAKYAKVNLICGTFIFHNRDHNFIIFDKYLFMENEYFRKEETSKIAILQGIQNSA